MARAKLFTVACTPDCFSASISSRVKGCTNCPSFISSLVASVSSEHEMSFTNSVADEVPYQLPPGFEQA